MSEFAALAQAFGPWVAVVLWAGISVFREWKTKGNDLKESYAAHAERHTGTMTRVNDTLVAMNARLQRLEDRLDEDRSRDTDEAIVPASKGRR